MARKLYCEGLVNPVGIDKLQPELSWKMVGETEAQKSFQIQILQENEIVFDSKIVPGNTFYQNHLRKIQSISGS